MVKTVTSIQVTANDTVAFYNGTDVVMTLSQIMPPSVYIDYTNTSIVIYNQANSSDEKTKFEFPAVYVQQVGANSYTKLNSYALQTEITARVMQVYKDLTTEIFKGCCEAGGCQADGCSILYRYNSELNEGDWYYDAEGGVLRISMNSFSNQLFDSLLPAMPIDSWVTFISSADSTLYAVFQITNAGTIVGGYVEYEATLVDGSSSFPVNTVFCFNLMAAGGSPVIGITSGNTGINVGGSYPSYTISNAMTVAAGTGITVTGTYPNYVINSNAAGVTLSSAGGTESLVNDGTGPTLAIKGITAGSGVSLSSTGTALTISSTGASGVTSVGLSMPPAFTVTNSPVTSSGTLAVTANGNSSQYIDGTGSLQTFLSTQNLQNVTTLGNETTQTIITKNVFGFQVKTSFNQLLASLKPNTIGDEGELKIYNIYGGPNSITDYKRTGINNMAFPTSGSGVFALSVNGITPNASTGDISIPVGTGTVTNVSASVPSPTSPALSVNVTNPTSTPSIDITANGTSSQLIDGTGALQTIPTGLPPTGTAGGDLSGTYPNPTVDGIHGIDLQSGTPTSGDVWVYGGSPAKWQHQMLHASQVDNDSAVTGTHVSDALNHLDSTKEPTITAGTTAQYWRGDKSWQTLDKSAVGLSNVDNTSDANKPISTATQTALNAKVSASSPALTGTPTAPTAATGTNTTQIATTAFVQTATLNTAISQVGIFGDGGDGAVTVTSAITLTDDKFYSSLTISGGGSINTAGYRIFVSGTLDLTNAGANAIYNNGGNPTNSTSSVGLPGVGAIGKTVSGWWSVTASAAAANVGYGGPGGAGGGNGTAGSAGLTPTALSATYNSCGGPGGAGGAGGFGNAAGGNGGAGQSSGTTIFYFRTLHLGANNINSILQRSVYTGTSSLTLTSTPTVGGGHGGGGGGAGGGTAIAGNPSGGSGAGGGGIIVLFAKTISIGASTNSAAISARGGTGATSSAGTFSAGGAGGGGGGGGGYIYVVCGSIQGNGTFINASGGTGGAGSNGAATKTGGTGGTGGNGGRITIINLSADTLTQVDGTATTGTAGTVGAVTAGGAGGAGATTTYTY